MIAVGIAINPKYAPINRKNPESNIAITHPSLGLLNELIVTIIKDITIYNPNITDIVIITYSIFKL
jgi:hypothetical protein